LNKIFFKYLTSKDTISDKGITLEDLKLFDYSIYQSLKYLAEDKKVDFSKEEFTFSIMNIEGKEIDLIPGGKDIKVTQQKRKEYTKKVARYYLYEESKE